MGITKQEHKPLTPKNVQLSLMDLYLFLSKNSFYCLFLIFNLFYCSFFFVAWRKCVSFAEYCSLMRARMRAYILNNVSFMMFRQGGLLYD